MRLAKLGAMRRDDVSVTPDEGRRHLLTVIAFGGKVNCHRSSDGQGIWD
jgi:hypothetical protein